MKCSEEQKKIVKLNYEEWTPLLGEAIKELLRKSGIDVNGGKASLKIVGNNEKPKLHLVFTTVRQLMDEKKDNEEEIPQGTKEIEDVLDMEMLSEPELENSI